MKHIKLIPSLLISLSVFTFLATPISAANLPANYYVSIAKERGTDGYNNSFTYNVSPCSMRLSISSLNCSLLSQ